MTDKIKYIVKNCPLCHYCKPCKKYHCGYATLLCDDDDGYSMNCIDNDFCRIKEAIKELKWMAIEEPVLRGANSKNAEIILSVFEITEEL